jgi:hypothetical protein
MLDVLDVFDSPSWPPPTTALSVSATAAVLPRPAARLDCAPTGVEHRRCAPGQVIENLRRSDGPIQVDIPTNDLQLGVGSNRTLETWMVKHEPRRILLELRRESVSCQTDFDATGLVTQLIHLLTRQTC